MSPRKPEKKNVLDYVFCSLCYQPLRENNIVKYEEVEYDVCLTCEHKIDWTTKEVKSDE